MFDFINYTYSGIISVLSTLFGLAYPLVLGCIEKIDRKYGSTKLTERFKKELVYIRFRKWLVVNLIVAVLFPFLMDGCSFGRSLIAIQSICVIWMVFYAFRLFALIMQYYDAKELMKSIETDFEKAFEEKDKLNEAIYFTQWSDLTSVLINSADESLVQSVYDEWYNYVLNKREEYKNKPIVYDDYFYEGITRLNENLCKSERKPISVNNTNTLLTSLIEGDANVTDKTFSILWQNLRVQLHYGRVDLIMEYWKSASQKYEYFLRELSSYDIDIETQRPYSEADIDLRKKQREQFFEFHIMLCSMLIQEKKYNLVEQMLLFSNSEPPTYPLVPSRLYDILQWLVRLNTKDYNEIFYYQQRYPMPNMHGLTSGRIVAATNCYLALLIYRLYAIYWYFGMDYVLGTGVLPETQSGLSKFKDILQSLKFWLLENSKNKDLLSIIQLTDFDVRIKTLNEQCVDEKIPGPLEIIENLENNIETSIKRMIIEQPLDEEIINKEINQVKDRLLLLMNPYSDFINSSINEGKSYNLNSSLLQLYTNKAFQKDSDTTYVGMADTMINCIWQRFSHFFSSAFFSMHRKVDYKIDSSILFKALDKLIDNCNEYQIICFGMYLDHYLNQIDGLEKIDNGIYRYKWTTLLSLSCPTKVFSQRIYIIKKTQIPKLTFKEPTVTANLNEVYDKYALYMGVVKIEDINEDLPPNIVEEVGDQREYYCLFKASWIPILHFSSTTEMICLKINYKMTDEGNWNSLDDITPIFKSKTNR